MKEIEGAREEAVGRCDGISAAASLRQTIDHEAKELQTN